MYDVSIVTVNYNSSDDTLNMVRSVKKNTSLNYELIIVDNNSSLDEFRKLDSLNDIKNIKVIRSKINLGFAGGNMLGFKEVNSKYCFFQNNDTLVMNNVIDKLYKACENDENIGLISPQLYDENRKRTTTFRSFPNIAEKYFGKGFQKLISRKKIYNNKKEYHEIIDVGVVSGASMFFRKKVFDKIGGFDTNFFLYCEEEDLSKRVWESGFKVCLEPRAHLIHLCGNSTSRNFKIEREFLISYYWLINKHFDFLGRFFMKLHIFFKYLTKAFKDGVNMKLFLFILNPRKEKYSLKYEQKTSDE
ncbi:MAG: hypothetical protein C0625_12370 [Arcobacter sp.]|nr:MAG: hypothetical protein C0625_12370 [Arcobacter sp.]